MNRVHPSFAAFLFVVGVVACGESPGPVETMEDTSQSPLTAKLASEALAAVGPGGLFTEVVRNPAGGAPPEISLARAREIPAAWSGHYAPLHSRLYDARRGSSIDWGNLSVCGRPFYAAAAFEAPSGDVPLSIKRTLGPWWLVTICGAGGEPQLSVAVSAWATDLEIVRRDDADRPPSRLRPALLLAGPARSGVHLVTRTIPAGGSPSEAFLMPPERAVEMVVTLTGATVVEVPELIHVPGNSPQLSVWRIRTDTEVQVQVLENGEVATASEFFVGFHTSKNGKGLTAVMIADPEQPSFRTLEYRPSEIVGQRPAVDGARVSREAPRRPGYPVLLRPVAPPSGNTRDLP